MQLKSQFIGFCTGSHILLLTLVLLLQVLSIAAERSCYKCEGAECIEKSHRFVEKCSKDENICATIFAGETIQAKGCLNTIPEKFRQKCNGSDIDILGQCHKCNDDECNEWALSDLYCAQCDSRWNPECSIEEDSIMVKPTRCHLSRTPNLLCYALKKEKRIVRGCATTLEEQRTCMTSDGCYFCNPSIAPDCNRIIPALQGNLKMLLPSHCDNICGATKFLLLALLLVFQIDSNAAERSCNVCEGDDCNQIGHERKEICNNGQQVCATVFDGESILAKGCLNTIPENLRMKCQGSDVDILNQCHKCNDDDCNEWIPSAFFCVQCDSKTDPTCTIQDDIIYKDPTRCNLNRVPNILCYALKKGDRIKRGCATTLEEQKTCLTSDGCYFCNPSIMPGCNSLIPFLEDSDEQTTESPTHQPTKPPPQPPVTHKPNTGAAIGASASSYIVIATALFWKYLW